MQAPTARAAHTRAALATTQRLSRRPATSAAAVARPRVVEVATPTSVSTPAATSPTPTPSLPLTLTLASTAAAGLLGTGFDPSGPTSIAQAIGVLASVVAIHEAGHFYAAVTRGVRVSAFSVGIGPALWTTTGENGVEYALRAIPLGGYVAFPDDDPESEIPADDPDLLKNRPLPDRAVVISAGVAANLVSAALILAIQAATVGVAVLEPSAGVAVPKVSPGSVAALAGLQSGDSIVAVDGTRLGIQGAVDDAVARVRSAAGKTMRLSVVRGNDTKEFAIDVVPAPSPDGSGGRIGVQLATRGVNRHDVARTPGAVVRAASREYKRLGGAVVGGLKALVTDFGHAASRVAGPVAIVATGAEVARTDDAGLFTFAAVVSLNLAVVNLLPLPALDGGYLALLIVEAARGGVKLPRDVEATIMASGLLALMAAGAVLVVRYTLNLSGL